MHELFIQEQIALIATISERDLCSAILLVYSNLVGNLERILELDFVFTRTFVHAGFM